MHDPRTLLDDLRRAEVVHDFAAILPDRDGNPYHVRAWAEPALRTTAWSGWLEFLPLEPDRAVVRTGIETTQITPDRVAFWARGLQAPDLAAALDRAKWRCGVGSASQPICVAEYDPHVFTNDRKTYRPRAYARIDHVGHVVGWLEFEPLGGAGHVLRTGVQTTQPTVDAVTVWASTLDAMTLDAALERATARYMR
jgi:hypothetical protein